MVILSQQPQDFGRSVQDPFPLSRRRGLGMRLELECNANIPKKISLVIHCTLYKKGYPCYIIVYTHSYTINNVNALWDMCQV